MLLILITEIVIASLLLTLYIYRKLLFNNLFNLILAAVLIAFIPNFVTSLLLSTECISNIESQIAFGTTGSVVLVFLYKVLSKYEVK